MNSKTPQSPSLFLCVSSVFSVPSVVNSFF